MKKIILSFAGSYALLALYFHLIPIFFHMNDLLRFLHMLMFFPLAWCISKVMAQPGLTSYGLIFFKGWYRNLAFGLLIGFACWCVLFGLRFFTGEYVMTGVKPFSESLAVMGFVAVGFGIGSLISDMIVRGLVYSHFKDHLSFYRLTALAVLIYALDDFWLEGFSLQNFIFSVCLGLSLAYAFFKTNSIWANTGLHAGLNIAYGMFFGVPGVPGAGVFQFRIIETNSLVSTWLSSLLAIVMFAIVYVSLTWFSKRGYIRFPVKNHPN